MRDRGAGDGRAKRYGFDEFMGGADPAAVADEGEPGGVPSIDALLASKGELPTGYARIVRSTMTLDVEAAYERVTAGLRKQKTAAHRLEYGEIVDQLDEASELCLLANQLAAVSAVTVARYEADLQVLTADMRAQATAALSTERGAIAKGEGKKTITDADVEARMAGAYPAEYRRLNNLLAEAKAAAKYIAALPDQWGARRRELDGLVRTVRKT